MIGQSIQLTAQVSSTRSYSGLVDFQINGTSLGTSGVGASGTATFTTSFPGLAAGNHTLRAAYAGNGEINGSTSSNLAHTINKGETTVTLVPSPAKSKPGQSVKLTATVAITAPAQATLNGNVTFKLGSRSLGPATTLVSGKATLTTDDLPIGTNSITATYSGTAALQGSSDAAGAKVDPRLGPEFLVNTMKTNSQQTPAIARFAGAAFVTVWASNLQDGSGYGIYGQRYDNIGRKVGAELRVNTTAVAAQTTPAVAPLKGGGFVVAWASAGQDKSGSGIYAQVFTAAGAPSGREFRVNTKTTGDQVTPAIAGFLKGGFVLAWNSELDGSGAGVFAQRYDAAGKKAGFEWRVNTKRAGDQINPAVAALGNGSFVIVWQSEAQDGSNFGINAQRYSGVGTPLGNEFRVNTQTAESQSLPAVAGTRDGGFVVAWQSGAVPDIFAKRYKANGAKAGEQFGVNTRTAGDQSEPAISAFDDGGFVVSWTSKGQDGSGQGVFAQIYKANGTPLGGEFAVNTTTANNQSQASFTAFEDGNFVGVWTSRNQDGSLGGIYGQRFDAGIAPSP